ncbi:hypothetical protein HDU93_006771, partial [Gonapodya sp. JEL0774]
DTTKEGYLSHVLSFNPGDSWEYGVNIDVLGWIVEIISGQKAGRPVVRVTELIDIITPPLIYSEQILQLEDFMQENIFKPLGMTQTSFFISEEDNKRRLKIAQRLDDGTLIPTFLPELIAP